MQIKLIEDKTISEEEITPENLALYAVREVRYWDETDPEFPVLRERMEVAAWDGDDALKWTAQALTGQASKELGKEISPWNEYCFVRDMRVGEDGNEMVIHLDLDMIDRQGNVPGTKQIDSVVLCFPKQVERGSRGLPAGFSCNSETGETRQSKDRNGSVIKGDNIVVLSVRLK